MRLKIDELDFIKDKIFFSAKVTVEGKKRRVPALENIFVHRISNKEIVSRTYKELSKDNKEKMNSPMNKLAKEYLTKKFQHTCR